MPGPTFPQFTAKDFQDSGAYKMNSTIAFIMGKLSKIEQSISGIDSSVSTSNTKIDQFITNGGNTTNNITNVGNDVFIDASLFCASSGVFTDACINAAIQSAPSDGATVYCKAGTWALAAPILIDKANITLMGDGDGTVLQRTVDMPGGVVQVQAVNTTLLGFTIDGTITTYTQIDFSTLFGAMGGDPQHPDLTKNSSVWLSAGMHNFTMDRVIIYRGGGYSLNCDSRTANTHNIKVVNCTVQDCISIVYTGGLQVGNFGSWCGGFLFQGGGGTGYNGTVYGDFKILDVVVSNNTFKNITGHGIWAHSYSLTNLHSNFVHSNNTLSDIGRDGILTGALIGGAVIGNTLYRIGYIAGHPRYYQGQYAVGIDTSGYATNLQYVGNSIMCVNGGGMDLDGMTNSTVSGNTIIIPDSTDPLYVTDEIASYGYGGSGNITKGIQSGNTYDARGAKNVTLSGNTIKNMGVNSIALVNAQYYFVTGNNIYQSATAFVPILLACTENNPAYTAPLPRLCKNNVITDNTIYFNCPPIAGISNWCIAETDSLGALPGPNYVFLNIISGTNSGEFLPSITGAASGSSTSLNIYTNTTNSSAQQANVNRMVIQKEDIGTASSTKFYRKNMATNVSKLGMLITDFGAGSNGAIVNVSNDGADGGSFTTGTRNAFGTFDDYMYTNKFIWDGFTVAARYNLHTAAYDAQANVLTDDYGLFRYIRSGAVGTGGDMQYSISTLAGARVWQSIGSSAVSLTATQVAYGSGSNLVTSTSDFFFTSGTSTLQISGSIWAVNQVPLLANVVTITKGAVGQTGNLSEWRDSSGVTKVAIDPGGAMYLRTSGTPSVVAGTGVFRYNTGTSKLQGSDDGGSTWTNLIGTGSTVAGSDKQIQFNQGGSSFGASSNFYFDYTNQFQVITGITTTPGLYVLTSYIDSAEGFRTASTNTDAIQAPLGGVTSKYLISTVSLTQIAVSTGTAGLSGAGQGRLIFDSATNTFKVSQNGAAYVSLVSSPGGSPTWVQYNNSGAFGGSTNFRWIDGSQQLQVFGVTGTAGIVTSTSYIQSAEGFLTTSSSSTAVNVASGGVTALSLISIRNDAAPGLTLARLSATARNWGMGIDASGFFFIRDVTSGFNRFSITADGTVYGAQISFNGRFTVSRNAATDEALALFGYGSATGGFSTTSTSSSSIQSPSGGIQCQAIAVLANSGGYSGAFNSIQSAGGINLTGSQGLYMLGTQVIDINRNVTANTLVSNNSCTLNNSSFGVYDTIYNIASATYRGSGPYRVRGVVCVNNNYAWVGQGVDCRDSGVAGTGFFIWDTGTLSHLTGYTGTFNPNSLSTMVFKGGILINAF